MTDDGFINLRVVALLMDGHGPVFNPGERVEVATSPLWVAVLAVGDALLPLQLEWVAVVLGLAGSVGGLALLMAGAVAIHRRLGGAGPVVPVGAAVLAVLPPVWDFSTSGLEGGLTMAWLGTVGFVLGRWAGRASGLRPVEAALVGLGPLVRPDLGLVTVVALVGILVGQWDQDGRASRARLLAAAAAVPLAYQVFRMGYYASLVPNTALAKAGGRSRWSDGVGYLVDLTRPYVLVLPVVLAMAFILRPAIARARAAGDRRVLVALAVLPVGGLLHGAYVVRVGGDYMHGRLLLPTLIALMAPVAAIPVEVRRHRFGPARRSRNHRVGDVLVVGAAAMTVAWSLVCLTNLRRDSTVVPSLFVTDARAGNVASFGSHAVTAADQGWPPGRARAHLPDEVVLVAGRPVDVDAPAELPTPASASFGIGVGGYAYGPDVHVIDMLGLADPVTARFQLTRPGPTGHEKAIPRAWLAARISTGPVDPDALPVLGVAPPLWESAPGRFDADTDAARSALRCGDLQQLADAVREPLTPGRFLSNFVAAPRLTALAVPADPAAARSHFCGPTPP